MDTTDEPRTISEVHALSQESESLPPLDEKVRGEHSIILSCQRSDLTDFAQLYDRYHQAIYRYLYYRTFDRALSEDLASQTFLKALEKIRTYDVRRGAFAAWLYGIARNALTDHFRASRPRAGIEEIEDLPGPDDPHAETGDRLQLRQIRSALSTLDPLKRDIVLLRLWDGLSYRDIAAIVGKNEGNCKVIFSRTIAQLRSTLNPSAFAFLLLASFLLQNHSLVDTSSKILPV